MNYKNKIMIKKYLTTRKIDEQSYAEEICARSREEAEAICRSSGTTLEGEAYATTPAVSGEMVIDFIIKGGLVQCETTEPLAWRYGAADQLDAFISNPRPDKPDIY